MRRVLAASCLAGVLLGLSGCAPSEPQATDEGAQTIDVDVDTPELRGLRTEAGIEPCLEGPAEAVDGGLPDLTLPCLGGGEAVSLASLQGPLVLSFWAQNCAPCRTEMPILQQFHEDNRGEIAVVGIDWQDVQPARALRLAKETGATYPLLADPGDETSGAGPIQRVRGLPMLVLVDEHGKVVHQEFVALRSRAQLDRLVEEHLGAAG